MLRLYGGRGNMLRLYGGLGSMLRLYNPRSSRAQQGRPNFGIPPPLARAFHLGIERIAQAIPQKVESEHGQRKGYRWEQHHVRV